MDAGANKFADVDLLRSSCEPRTINSVGVIGAGVMGRAIAAANIEREIAVTITDSSSEALSRGVDWIRKETTRRPVINGPHFTQSPGRGPLLRTGTSIADLGRCDLIIESVVERLDAKKRLLMRLEPHLCADTIVASNTSCIPISEIVGDMQHPERFCGLHFCHPVSQMPLVEVIPGEKTTEPTVATAVRYVQTLGKSPIVVQDGPGFLINRLLLPYFNEALELILQGASVKSVEAAAKEFGMSTGPLAHLDAIGIDVALRAGAVLYTAFPDRVLRSDLLVAMYKAGRLGQKSQRGFYAYDIPRSQSVDSEAERLIRERRRGDRRFTRDELTRRLFLPMLVEATRLLEERRVASGRDVDRALVDGIGFSTSKGGLLVWADTLGPAKIVELLNPLEQFGERYRPTNMLREMAKHARRFYE
jgi:3-hydroxyacyl-CoA dehydrogenase/enoyl-CoA hydratase/3-hydroxybutyryl-CoA epimerase/3-hydroxyacyl-CoA dehydrogenase/enoyl-CoA hydratase/3-hydroxybutyryl-CoA epimerase/enoyl-CoA isomerase